MTMSTPRPKYLNLFRIRQPLPAIVSILHRVSGALLFLLLPFLLTLFEMSLESQQSFARLTAVTSHWGVKLILIGLVWAWLHHFFAGLRHLALDLHVGDDLRPARATSAAVLAGSLVLTAIVAILIW